MTKGEEIQRDCEREYTKIRLAEKSLSLLRQSCGHEDTYEGYYSWRPGAQSRAIICSYCLTPIKYLDF